MDSKIKKILIVPLLITLTFCHNISTPLPQPTITEQHFLQHNPQLQSQHHPQHLFFNSTPLHIVSPFIEHHFPPQPLPLSPLSPSIHQPPPYHTLHQLSHQSQPSSHFSSLSQLLSPSLTPSQPPFLIQPLSHLSPHSPSSPPTLLQLPPSPPKQLLFLRRRTFKQKIHSSFHQQKLKFQSLNEPHPPPPHQLSHSLPPHQLSHLPSPPHQLSHLPPPPHQLSYPPSPHHLPHHPPFLQHTTCPHSCICETFKLTCTNLEWQRIPRGVAQGFKMADFGGNQISLVTKELLQRGGLGDVVRLNLSNNGVEKLLDGAFSDLTSLQFLDLSHNHITSLSPLTFQGLSLLSFLDLSHNSIPSINHAFHHMPELVRLNLDWNRIATLSNSDLQHLANLRFFSVAHNQLVKIQRQVFKSLEKIINLNLRHNHLESLSRLNIPSFSISHLDLSSCWLKQVPKGLPTSLQHLSLKHNQLQVLRLRNFQATNNIVQLDLSHNSIRELDKQVFSSMSHLQHLDLSRNHLHNIILDPPTSIKSLLLSSNQLFSLSFSQSSPIQHLCLHHNNFTIINTHTFTNLPNLNFIDLSYNSITHLPSQIFLHNPYLTILNLSSNPLTTLPSFHGALNLKTLNLSYIFTQFSTHPTTFFNFPHLEFLFIDSSPSLAHMLVTSKELLGNLSNLREMHLKKCGLEKLDVVLEGVMRMRKMRRVVVAEKKWLCGGKNTTQLLLEAFERGLIKQEDLLSNKCVLPSDGHFELTWADVINLTRNNHALTSLFPPYLPTLPFTFPPFFDSTTPLHHPSFNLIGGLKVDRGTRGGFVVVLMIIIIVVIITIFFIMVILMYACHRLHQWRKCQELKRERSLKRKQRCTVRNLVRPFRKQPQACYEHCKEEHH